MPKLIDIIDGKAPDVNNPPYEPNIYADPQDLSARGEFGANEPGYIADFNIMEDTGSLDEHIDKTISIASQTGMNLDEAERVVKAKGFRKTVSDAFKTGNIKAAAAIASLPEHLMFQAEQLSDRMRTIEKERAEKGLLTPHYGWFIRPSFKTKDEEKEYYDSISIKNPDSPMSKILNNSTRWFEKGLKDVLKRHPEWQNEKADNWLDLLTSPTKLAGSITESIPMLIAAGVLTATGHPIAAYSVVYAIEGEEAKQEALSDGQSLENAENAKMLYGTVSAAIEMFQLEQGIGIAKEGWNLIRNKVAHRMAKEVGKKTFTKELLKTVVKENVEEWMQGTWQETTTKIIYGKKQEGGLIGFVDRRLMESVVITPLTAATGGIGAVAGVAKGKSVAAKEGKIALQEEERMTRLKEDYNRIVEEGGPQQMIKLRERLEKERQLDKQPSIEAEKASSVPQVERKPEISPEQPPAAAEGGVPTNLKDQGKIGIREDTEAGVAIIETPQEELTAVVSQVRKNEGGEAANIVEGLHKVGIETDSTHSTDTEIVISTRNLSDENKAILQDAGIVVDKQPPLTGDFIHFPKQAQPPAAAEGAEQPPKKPPEQEVGWSETTPPEDTGSGAAKVETIFNEADIELKRIKDSQKGIGKLWRKVKRTTWDTSASIKKDLLKEGGKYGKEAVIRHDLIKGAGTKATRIINDATKDIYKGLSKKEAKTLDRIIQSRRIIAIDRYKPGKPSEKPLFATMKHPGGLSAEEHQAYIDNVPEKTRNKLNAKADMYFSVMRQQLDELRENGLIGEESYEALKKAGDYEPRRFIQHIDPERTGYTATGQKISVPDSGIKALEEGSFEALENDSQLLLGEVVKRTQARISRNNANQAIWQIVKDVPDNGIVQEAEIENIKRGEYTYKKAPAGYEKISVVVDGIQRQMLMPTEMAKEWVTSDPLLGSGAAQFFGWISGSKILKPMATGINPEFALTNFPRDIAHVLLTTEEYSPHLPLAIGQMMNDFNAVKGDVFTRKGRWLDYIDEGGGMEFLTHQGGVTSKTTGAMKDLQTALGYLGETSEIWTRLALRERAIRNGKSSIEATWIARNYLDFSQGGNLAKAVDSFVPYFNASIQGTRGIFRAAGRNPKVFTYKVAQLGMLATGLMLANRYRNREAWDNISSHDKANYFIITTPFSYKDENGDKRYLYFRIAKDQGQKVICTIFENAMAKYLGEDIDVDQVTDAARGMIVVTPSEMLPPAFDAALGYYANKDFWRNEEIWKGGEVVRKEEYTNYTHPAYVKWGEVSGMSPEKTKYALQQLFTSGNIYTSMVDWGLGKVMEKMPEAEKEKLTQDILRQQPFIRRILKATNPFTEHEKAIDEARKEENTRQIKQNRELDKLIDRMYAGEISRSEIYKYIDGRNIQDSVRLEDRFHRSEDFKDIPDRKWWLEISYLPPEVRATLYWSRYQVVDNEEKRRLERQKDTLPGISTERFEDRLAELKIKGE